LESRARELWPPEVVHAFERIGIFILTEVAGIGHILLNHPNVLHYGLEAIAADAEKRANSFRKQGNKEAANFCEAARTSCDAVITFAHRHAELAQQLAAEEEDAKRKQELLDVAERCSKVPAQPATTFAEALQAIYFTHISAQIEAGYESAFSLGRIDQFLWPYYEKDKQVGRIAPESAQELLECLYVKLSHIIPLFDSDVSLAFSGLTTFANAVVGGVDVRGADATNELSFIVIRAMNHMRTPNPTLGARIHRETPPHFLMTACRALIEGMGNLQFLSDESIIGAQRQRGIPLKDARDYAIIGCVEPAVPGRSFTSSDAALFNLALPLELALNDGYAHVFHENLGIHTGDPRRFNSMAELLEAYTKQTKYLVGLMAQGLDGLAQANAELKPTPFTSAITERCLEAGKDVTGGGAVYNFTGVQGVGLATVADSLAAIDQLLYRDKRVTWDLLLTALSSDFRDSEPVRQMMLSRVPKYGNDEELADKYAAFVAQLYSDEVSRYRTYRGGTLLPGLYSVATHIAFGVMVGASPSGRRAGTPLSCGVTPAPGAAREGPTAALQSVAKLNHRLVANGSALNLRLSPTHLKGEQGAQLLSTLITTYFGLGGMQIQFNLVDSQTLRKAQEHPEEYRDLVVRVAGYSALFTDLDRLVQDELIARTEFQPT
jgi:formate C-acetyltransferase